MSEIEKMYENAGVKKQYDYTVIKKNYNGKIGYTKRAVLEKVEQFKNKTLRIIEVCFFYPEFTAEKQLELIKWLVRNQVIFKITYHREFLWCSDVEWVKSDCYEEFEESLANLINTIWQGLSEEEKQQVKEILE